MTNEEAQGMYNAGVAEAVDDRFAALRPLPELGDEFPAAPEPLPPAEAQPMNPKDAAALDRVPFHVYPPAGLIEGTMGCADGAAKYGPYNWRERNISLMQYVGAIMRHCQKIVGGEDVDAESTYRTLHLGQINATSAILIDAHYAGALIDDRPKRQVDASALITDFNARIKAVNAAKREGK